MCLKVDFPDSTIINSDDIIVEEPRKVYRYNEQKWYTGMALAKSIHKRVSTIYNKFRLHNIIDSKLYEETNHNWNVWNKGLLVSRPNHFKILKEVYDKEKNFQYLSPLMSVRAIKAMGEEYFRLCRGRSK
jgi:hypothetical protein